jgi:hypothetical protein
MWLLSVTTAVSLVGALGGAALGLALTDLSAPLAVVIGVLAVNLAFSPDAAL